MIKKSFFLLTVFLLSLNTEAQNALNSEAFDIAQRFMAKKGITLVNDDKAATRGNAEPYSIFSGEDGKGFAIVSNGVVVGYSTNNSCDINFLSLGTAKQSFKLSPKSPIDFLIKAEWGQGEPYNWQTPMVLNEETGSYENAVTGCSATALAQIMYYYKIEKCKAIEEFVYNGVKKLDALPETNFEWNAILPKYIPGEYTEEQGQAVAKLLKYCGYSLRSSYGHYNTFGGMDLDLIKKCFDISDESYQSYTEDGYSLVFTQFSDKELEAFMDNELEKGRPLIMSANNKEGRGAHAYIIDGRDDTGRYHVNCGWGGKNNGYYIMSQELFMAEEETDGVLDRLGSPFFTVIIMPKGWTDINPIEVEGTKKQIYNLQGLKVGDKLEGLPKGIYIKDGKKVIIK